MSDVVVTSIANLQNGVQYGDGQTFVIDEPKSAGGDGVGPDPYTLLLAALGGCISMTVNLYARRKGWQVERVTVRLRQERIHAKDCAECDQTKDAQVHKIERSVKIEGQLTTEQQARLQEIAKKCPVHRSLTSQIVIRDME